LEKDCRERQVDTKGSVLCKANLLAYVGLGVLTGTPQLVKSSPTTTDLRRSWATEGPFFLPGMEKWEIISVNSI